MIVTYAGCSGIFTTLWYPARSAAVARSSHQRMPTNAIKPASAKAQLITHSGTSWRSLWRTLSPLDHALAVAYPPLMAARQIEFLESRGVLGDWREPDVIRISPAPLYNNHVDVLRFARTVQEWSP